MVINNLKIGAIIQARTNSKRFPNKIFLKLPYNSNFTVLDQIIARIKRVKKINEIVISTTKNINDDKVESFCKKNIINCFRGSEENVLSRFYFTAKKYELDVIIRITADNPCIDYCIIENILNLHCKDLNDYTKTENYPRGTNLEIISFGCLENTYKNAKLDYEKEHVTPYMNNSEIFKIKTVKAPEKLTYPGLRLTLDEEKDYAFLCAIFCFLYNKNKFFTISDIINLIERKKWLLIINNKVMQKKIC